MDRSADDLARLRLPRATLDATVAAGQTCPVVSSAGAETTHYVVVVEAESSAHFRDEPIPLQVNHFPTAVGPVTITFRTRYSEEGLESPVPREMWIDVRGVSTAPFDDAVTAYAQAGAAFLPLIALVANATVAGPDVKLAFDNSPGRDRREFFQSFVPEKRGQPVPARRVDVQLALALFEAFKRHPETVRLHRAAESYRGALIDWRPGREPMALAQLYWGVEAVTKPTLMSEMARAGADSADAFAAKLGIPKRQLDPWIRRNVIFQGDAETYKKAKDASDGLEHGYLPFPQIHTLAADARDRTARYLREAILGLLDLHPTNRDRLISDPFDEPLSEWLARHLRGSLLGKTDDVAAPDQEYPLFMWTSSLKEFRRNDDDTFTYLPEETFVERLSEHVRFERRSFEVRGASVGARVPPEREFTFIRTTVEKLRLLRRDDP
jgi:hypothetical protein